MRIKAIGGSSHEVWKYIKDPDGQEHIWSNTWYGHHIIGQDCEWYTEPPTTEQTELWKELFVDIGKKDNGDNNLRQSYDLAIALLSKKYSITRKQEAPEAVEPLPDLGICKECNKRPAAKDYNGHQYYVCDPCHHSLNNEFDDEYR